MPQGHAQRYYSMQNGQQRFHAFHEVSGALQPGMDTSHSALFRMHAEHVASEAAVPDDHGSTDA